MTSYFERVLLALSIGVFAAIFSAWLRAQLAEKPPASTTKQWDIGDPLADVSHFYPSQVTVIDTTGVCLYVYRGYGIAAVPKTQLRSGQGCQ